ncbi:MAG: tRNA pseudouridine(55) synthase TruB [Pyrinomonadaceae bacterium]
MDGLLIIDKPAGMTSHDVVSRVRRILRERRIGHTGTLDPFATGVLILLVGRATRLAQFLSGADKEYEAVIRLGFATDTGDVDGSPLSISNDEERRLSWSDDELKTAMSRLRGEISQVPPMYSAKKRDGRRLYELARRGEEIERQPVRVTIHTFELGSETSANSFRHVKRNEDGTTDVAVRVVCSAGTYVRSLAEDFGKLLGIGAHVAQLRRTRAGDFRVGDAIGLEQLQQIVDQGSLGTILLPPDAALSRLPFVHLSARDAQLARNGMAISLKASTWLDEEKVRIKDEEGRLIGVGHYEASRQLLHPRVVLAKENTD